METDSVFEDYLFRFLFFKSEQLCIPSLKKQIDTGLLSVKCDKRHFAAADQTLTDPTEGIWSVASCCIGYQMNQSHVEPEKALTHKCWFLFCFWQTEILQSNILNGSSFLFLFRVCLMFVIIFHLSIFSEGIFDLFLPTVIYIYIIR